MKKLLVISGSHKKNGTGIKLLNLFKSHFDVTDYTFETIHLSDYDIGFCKGCTVCFKVGEHVCPCKDDVTKIVEKMKSADGYIFISPIYGMNISGQLKTFMDRITYLYHRPTLIGKPAIYLASTDLGGSSLTGHYMKYILNAMGLRTVGVIGAYAVPLKADASYQLKLSKKVNLMAEKFINELKSEAMPKPNFSELFHFNKWQVKNSYSKDIYPADYQYWLENGWFDTAYYYPCKVKVIDKIRLGMIKRQIGKMIVKRV